MPPAARPRSPRGERPSSAPGSPGRPVSPRPLSPRGQRPDSAAPASPRGKKSPAPAVSANSTRRPSAARPPLAPGSRPPRAPSGATDGADEQTARSDGTEEQTPRSDDSGEPIRETGSGATPRRTKEKEKDPPPSRVRVAVRLRPPVKESEKADESGGTGHLLCQGGRLWLVEGKDGDSSGMSSPRASTDRNSTRQFVFDWALPPQTTQEEVFGACCIETGVLKGITEGINGCVMCYGQTGAGKTHTLGNATPGLEGIVPRSLRYLLDADGGGKLTMSVSMVQIYMENIYDLLEPQNSVDLRESAEGVVLSGASAQPVESLEQAMGIIEEANKNRVTSATSMNDASSRSHSVLVLDVATKQNAKLYQAKLHLVDLAGSERVKKSEVTGQAFDEACFINNSLTCLGRCVQALAAGPKGGKPPFRETKLTRLLSGAFGGRANTALCVCVGPSKNDAFETLNSLQFGQQAMSVKVQAKANATVDYAALEEQLFWQVYELQVAAAQAEAEAWRRVKPRYDAQEGLREELSEERERLEALREELDAEGERQGALKAEREAALKQARLQHEQTMAGLKRQAAASRKELGKLRAAAGEMRVGDGGGGGGGADDAAAPAAAPAAADAAAVDDEASQFGAAFLKKSNAKAGGGGGGGGGGGKENGGTDADGGDGDADGDDDDEKDVEIQELEERAEGYQNAVERAWAEVQRMDDERQQMDARFEATRQEAATLDREKEEMEATLHEVAADLGRLALLYRSQGKAQHAVPLYMTALAIYEKTLGPEHPEVAKDLVNLGNAFCDQNQHSEAVPLYLRALAIDQAALGDDHPEVAMDLSNLGIVYRVQGRVDEATALFQRAHGIMLAALGPDDPKTQTVARNLASTQVIEVPMQSESPRGAPPGLEKRLSTPRSAKATSETIEEKGEAARDKREATLQKRVDKAAESALPAGQRTPRGGAAPPKAPGAGPPAIAPLKLNLNPPSSADAPSGAATPRSSYSRAINEAKSAAADSRKTQGSARSMLHRHVKQTTDS